MLFFLLALFEDEGTFRAKLADPCHKDQHGISSCKIPHFDSSFLRFVFLLWTGVFLNECSILSDTGIFLWLFLSGVCPVLTSVRGCGIEESREGDSSPYIVYPAHELSRRDI